jgi:putative FmdB family regulatory protein
VCVNNKIFHYKEVLAMPLYEYTCKTCKTRFTVLQRIGATEKNTQCIYCGSADVKREMSSFSSTGYGSRQGAGPLSGGSF